MTDQNPEITVPWSKFNSREKQIIITQYLKLLQLDESQLQQLDIIFDLVKPDMILGRNETESYCRVKTIGNQDAIALLINNYI